MGLGRGPAAGAGGRELAGSCAEAAAAGESQRVPVCAGSAGRQVATGEAAGEEADVGEGDRDGRASGDESGSGPDGGGDARVPAGGGRDEFLFDGVQPGDRAVLREHARAVQHLYEDVDGGVAGGSRLSGRRRPSRAGREGAEDSARVRYSDGAGGGGAAAGWGRRELVGG